VTMALCRTRGEDPALGNVYKIPMGGMHVRMTSLRQCSGIEGTAMTLLVVSSLSAGVCDPNKRKNAGRQVAGRQNGDTN